MEEIADAYRYVLSERKKGNVVIMAKAPRLVKIELADAIYGVPTDVYRTIIYCRDGIYPVRFLRL